MASARTSATSERKLWSIVATAQAMKGLTDAELAILAHTTPQTVSRDKKNPMKTPIGRYVSYLKAVLSTDEIVATLMHAIADKAVD